ncbi:MAG: zf-HC2 domain-containing protein [Anaerolineales bacterium]|nr:zf-HC2 domain-containing protein [Anaerolineales bacterium]
MSEHVTQWLGSYLDGELQGSQLRQVEKHLEECPDCRGELEALRNLSAVLQEAPLPESLPTAERFAARVALRLPRQARPIAQRKALELGWWLAPVAMLCTWIFIQTVFTLSGWVMAADRAGLLGDASAILVQGEMRMGAITGVLEQTDLLTSETAGQLLNAVENFGWNTLVQVIIELGIALLYLGWLALWLARKRQAVLAVER